MKRTRTLSLLLLAVALAACSAPAPTPEVKPQDNPAVSNAPDAAPAANPDDKIAAKIDGQPVYMSELDEKVKGLEDKFRELNPNLKFPDDKVAQLRRDFLDRLIRDRVLLAEADRRGITVDDEEVNKRIDQLKMLFGQAPEAQAKFLEGIKDMDRFRREVANQARISKLMDAAVKDNITITPEEVSEFFKAHPESFAVQETVKIGQILITFKSDGAAEPTEEAKQQTLEKTQEVLARLEAGEDFATVAREVSEDKTTAQNGGEIGPVPKGRLPEAVENIAFGLTPGQLSQPIETKSGYYIVKLLEHTAGRMPTFDEVKDKVENTVRSQKQSQLSEAFVQELKTKAKIENLL